MVRYPHTFSYYPQGGSFQNGDYLPGESNAVEFKGRLVLEQNQKLNEDGSMIQTEGKIYCRNIGFEPQKGDTVKFGNRSFKIYSPEIRQQYVCLWVL